MQIEEGNGLSNYQVRRLSRFDKSYQAFATIMLTHVRAV